MDFKIWLPQLLAGFVLSFGLLGCRRNESAANRLPSEYAAEHSNAFAGRSASEPPSESSRGIDPEAAKPDPQVSVLRVDQIRLLVDQERFEEAKSILLRHLVANPSDPRAIFQLAHVLAATGDLKEAIATLDQPSIANSEAALPALGQAADWCLELGWLDDAESRYRQILRVAPDAILVHHSLAELLLRSGRPHAAVDSLRQLCRSGNTKQSELAALIAVGDAIAVPTIGPVAEARQEAIQGRYREAVEWLEKVIDTPDTPADVEAFYLRVLAESQQEGKLDYRLSTARPAVQRHADYWAALGVAALSEGDAATAVGALMQAVTSDGTDSKSILRFRQALRLAGRESWEPEWETQSRRQRKAIRLSNAIAEMTSEQADASANLELADAMQQLSDLLEQMGRRIEAVLWRSMAAYHRGDPQEVVAQLQGEFLQLARSDDAFPSITEQRFGIPEGSFSPPVSVARTTATIGGQGRAPAENEQSNWPSPPKLAVWRDISESIEMRHQFQVASQSRRSGFSIYQLIGGGIAALDFDLDGACDLYFAQGAADPPEFISDASNPLYRNLGSRVVDVSEFAGTSENGYTVGVTAGDWNHDGFDDLAINQLGSVVVLTNNTDGSFRRDVVWTAGAFWVPASVAMADVNSDGWLDLVALGYVDDKNVWLRPPRDEQGDLTKTFGPLDFSGAENQVIAGSPTGWKQATPLRSAETLPRASLGVVVGMLDKAGQRPEPSSNQIFIGNDQQNNCFWTLAEAGSDRWNETAILRGCAFGNYGNATASMGIAAADLNQDGFLDLHITNFYNEPASLYEGGPTGFHERTVQRGLYRHSTGVLGFGCAAVDFDSNGLPDLIVTNGHIDTMVSSDDPFEQPMQLFALQGGRYIPVSVDDPSGYWQRLHVGRAMAKLDFNRDGREDVAISNLNESSALLLNETPTDHHWLRLQLVGTDSPRYPVGASVELKAGQTLYHHVVAGDGYMCRNEPALTIGLGPRSEPVLALVTWPDGTQQEFSDLTVDGVWQLVEGDESAFPLRQ